MNLDRKSIGRCDTGIVRVSFPTWNHPNSPLVIHSYSLVTRRFTSGQDRTGGRPVYGLDRCVEEKRSRRRTKERSRQRKQWYGNRDIAIISSSYASFTVLIEEMTFDNVCIVCSSHFNSSRTTSNRSIREKIKRFTRTVIPRQNEQRDRLSLIMEVQFAIYSIMVKLQCIFC